MVMSRLKRHFQMLGKDSSGSKQGIFALLLFILLVELEYRPAFLIKCCGLFSGSI
jgi:hypothetical protein